MDYSWQDLLVFAAVAWAAGRVLRVFFGTIAQARTGACGGGCGCAKSKDAPAAAGDRPLVEISIARRPTTGSLPLAEQLLHADHSRVNGA